MKLIATTKEGKKLTIASNVTTEFAKSMAEDGKKDNPDLNFEIVDDDIIYPVAILNT